MRCSYCITIAAAVALYAVLKTENKKREGLAINEEERDRLAFMDLTDKEVSDDQQGGDREFALTLSRIRTSDMCYKWSHSTKSSLLNELDYLCGVKNGYQSTANNSTYFVFPLH